MSIVFFLGPVAFIPGSPGGHSTKTGVQTKRQCLMEAPRDDHPQGGQYLKKLLPHSFFTIRAPLPSISVCLKQICMLADAREVAPGVNRNFSVGSILNTVSSADQMMPAEHSQSGVWSRQDMDTGWRLQGMTAGR